MTGIVTVLAADINNEGIIDGPLFDHRPDWLREAVERSAVIAAKVPESDYAHLVVSTQDGLVTAGPGSQIEPIGERLFKVTPPTPTSRSDVATAILWNPQNNLARECNSHEAVRGTDYMEVARAFNTSGCSPEEPWWGWPVIGAIDTPRGTLFVFPGDWIITEPTGEIRVVPQLPPSFSTTVSKDTTHE